MRTTVLFLYFGVLINYGLFEFIIMLPLPDIDEFDFMFEFIIMLPLLDIDELPMFEFIIMLPFPDIVELPMFEFIAMLPVVVDVPIFEFIIMFEFAILEFIMFEFILLALVLAVSVQAIPIAPKTKTPERAIIFFILFKVSCLLQRLIIIYLSCKKITALSHPIYFWNIGQYKFPEPFSQIKNG